ncbi:MAG: hypothetical protein ACTHKZ_04485 [Lysobacteraceae bacterium]
MTRSDPQRTVAPILAGACLLASGSAAHPPLPGVGSVVAVAPGLWLYRRPATRRLGGAPCLLGALAFGTGLLFGTGTRLGHDMAARDAAPAVHG